MYSSVEMQIRKAIAEGKFDHLPGAGKPLPLDAWRRTPAHLRMSWGILKNAGYAPAEVSLRTAIATLKADIQATEDEGRKQRLIDKLNALMVSYSIRMERHKRP
jgi:hypothetical protein